MTMTTAGPEALAAGTAFVDLSSWRTVAVTGSDAIEWLNDIVSAHIADLASGEARRSLLLSPTGGVLASFTVASSPDGLLLVQDPAEPRPIDGLLSMYVLSSDVQVHDRTGEFAIFAFPGRERAPDHSRTVSAPSALGTGIDVVAPVGDHDGLAGSFAEAFASVGAAAVDAWRVATAVPRIGVDTADGDLPQECGLESLVSFDKGCYLGQESVAKVRNLGHPRRLLLSLESDRELSPRDEVVSGDQVAGAITSAGRYDDRWVALARIRWEHRDGRLRTRGGAELRARG